MMKRHSITVLLNILALMCGTASMALASVDAERQLEDNPLLDNWAKEEGLANLLNDKIESSQTLSPTNDPTKSPTNKPTNNPTTASPTAAPSDSPTQTPTLSPTTSPSISLIPSGQPSMYPTTHPSVAPSTSFVPTAIPSSKPSFVPSAVPSISLGPTPAPSLYPSNTPTIKPSSSPTETLSFAPSLFPSSSPTETPTKSGSPSQLPSELRAMESSIIIDRSKTRNATPMLIVGAACFFIMASTSIYLYRRGSQSRLDGSMGTPSVIEVSSSKHHDGNISPYSTGDGPGPGHNTFDVGFSESESRNSDEGTLEYGCTTNEQHLGNDGGLVDVDLETGRIGIDSVPNSVSIFKQAHSSPNVCQNNVLNTIEEAETPGIFRMPKSIYVPKMFQRAKESDENKKQIVTWNQIREEEDRSHASSGYAPASVPSPMLSPFVVKGLSSFLSPYSGIGKRGVPVNDCDQKIGPAAASLFKSSTKEPAMDSETNDTVKSPMREIVVKREAPSPGDSIFAGLENTASQLDDNCIKEQKSPKTIVSKSSDGSSIEWGIDVSKVQPSKASFEANVAELQNLLVSIKSLGSGELPSTEDNPSEVPMNYTDDSWESRKSGMSLSNQQNSPKSNSSSFLGNIDIAPIESSSTQGNSSTRADSPNHSCNSPQKESGITYKTELLNSSRVDSEGTFSFRNIFNDPKNDLYECHAPSGPLGVVVDSTPLGPRVRSLNPLSPIFGKISPGDVIVGVDEVDTVGIEAGEFWQIVSRKANQQKRILTILRI